MAALRIFSISATPKKILRPFLLPRLRGLSSSRVEPHQAQSLIDPGTRRVMTSDHDAFRESCRKFFTQEIMPFHHEWEKVGLVPRSVWKSAGSKGLLGVPIPAEYGGVGGDIYYASVMWDEQAYSGCLGPGFSIHSDICLPYLHHYGTEEQKKKYLTGACSGDTIVAIAMTEPGAGSDLQGIKTSAVADGDYLVLNGSKTFISNGQNCDVVIVVARTDLNAKKAAHGLSLVLVDAGTPGFTKGKNLSKIGLYAQDTSELFFDNVRVPRSNILGKVNEGFYQLMRELPQERLTIAGLGVAHAEACYEWTRTYVKERKAFGGTLSSLQTVRHKLAELKTLIAAGRAFFDQCLELHANGKLDAYTASMIKYHCTELENKVADECLQLHGGYGYMREFQIARAFVDARVQRIYGGSNEIMKELISRTI